MSRSRNVDELPWAVILEGAAFLAIRLRYLGMILRSGTMSKLGVAFAAGFALGRIFHGRDAIYEAERESFTHHKTEIYAKRKSYARRPRGEIGETRFRSDSPKRKAAK